MRKHSKSIIIISVILFFIIFILSISIGSVNVPIIDTVRIILNKLFGVFDISNINEIYSTIILNIRLPRVIMSCLVGASLAIAGSVMQGLLKNPLADGSTLGVASGSSIGAIIAIGLGITIPFLSELSTVFISIFFAIISLIVVLFIVKKIDKSMSANTVILSGIIFSMFASSVTSFLLAIFSNDTKRIVFWTLGSLASSNFDKVMIFLPIFLICIFVIFTKIPELNAYIMGENNAKYLGVNTKKTKILLYIFSSVLVGVSVAMTGNIAFVGLVIPNIARMIVKINYKYILPFCILLGAMFLTLTDLLSRTVIAPSELPIGTVTSLVGAVIFVYILYNFKKKEKN